MARGSLAEPNDGQGARFWLCGMINSVSQPETAAPPGQPGSRATPPPGRLACQRLISAGSAARPRPQRLRAAPQAGSVSVSARLPPGTLNTLDSGDRPALADRLRAGSRLCRRRSVHARQDRGVLGRRLAVLAIAESGGHACDPAGSGGRSARRGKGDRGCTSAPSFHHLVVAVAAQADHPHNPIWLSVGIFPDRG